jgi:hypothetical protein
MVTILFLIVFFLQIITLLYMQSCKNSVDEYISQNRRPASVEPKIIPASEKSVLETSTFQSRVKKLRAFEHIPNVPK